MPPSLPRLDPVGPLPRPGAAPPGVVLVLHGGRAHSTESGELSRLTRLRMLPFARAVAAAGPAAYLLRYRYRGWNAPRRDPVRDARWALAELAATHPGLPVVLVGHSMGGRAALAAAGAPNVTAVCALAPWLDASDPVDQLAGRSVLIAHGDRERYTSPRASYEFAVRAKRVTDRVARFDVPGSGHYLISRAGDWHALVRRFVVGVLEIEPEDPLIANTLRRPSPGGLSVPLPRRPASRGAER